MTISSEGIPRSSAAVVAMTGLITSLISAAHHVLKHHGRQGIVKDQIGHRTDEMIVDRAAMSDIPADHDDEENREDRIDAEY